MTIETPSLNAMLELYFNRLELSQHAELFDFQFATGNSEEATVRVARLRLPFEGEEMWFFGSLGFIESTEIPYTYSVSPPDCHQHHFIGTYDNGSLSLAELIGAAFHYDTFINKLDYGHTIPIGNRSPLRASGYKAALLFKAGIYQPFEAGEANLQFFSVIPLLGHELDIKKKKGVDKLLQEWKSKNKDILHVSVPAVM